MFKATTRRPRLLELAVGCAAVLTILVSGASAATAGRHSDHGPWCHKVAVPMSDGTTHVVRVCMAT